MSFPETFTTWPLNIKSAQGEAVKLRYHAIEEKPEHYWLYADTDHPADDVWYGTTNLDAKSEGCGGAVIPFTLVDGTVLKIKGPWHAGRIGRQTTGSLRWRARLASWATC